MLATLSIICLVAAFVVQSVRLHYLDRTIRNQLTDTANKVDYIIEVLEMEVFDDDEFDDDEVIEEIPGDGEDAS